MGESDNPPSRKLSVLPYRYFLTLMTALCSLPLIGGRKCFAMILTHLLARNNSDNFNNLVFPNCTRDASDDPSIDVDKHTAFLVHVTYFLGYGVLKIPGTVLAVKFSASRFLGFVVMVTSALYLTLPLVFWLNSTPLLFIVRFMQGVGEGIQKPVSVGLLSVWSTPQDQSLLLGIVFSGVYVSPAFASIITGAILCYVDATTSLYIHGGCGLLWSILWLVTAYDSPDHHPHLSHAERELYASRSDATGNKKKRIAVPWIHILTCPTVWTSFLGYFSMHFVYSLLVVEQPQYYLDAFHLNVADIGVFAMLPHVGLSITCTLGGILSDRLLGWGMSKTRTRKLMYTLGYGTEGLCLIGLYLTSDWRTAIALMSVGVSLGGLAETSFTTLAADLAPRYAGVISGIASLGVLGAVGNTLLASVLVGKSKSLVSWQHMFLITGVVHVTIVVVFGLFTKAERQHWADYYLEKEPLKPQNVAAYDSFRSRQETAVDSELYEDVAEQSAEVAAHAGDQTVHFRCRKTVETETESLLSTCD